ncbi:hypothetical protein D3C81_1601650 [compost metagenome]
MRSIFAISSTGFMVGCSLERLGFSQRITVEASGAALRFSPLMTMDSPPTFTVTVPSSFCVKIEPPIFITVVCLRPPYQRCAAPGFQP